MHTLGLHVWLGIFACLFTTQEPQERLTEAPVTFELAGVVRDTQGNAIGQASVLLICPLGSNFLGSKFGAEPFPVFHATTDELGSFKISIDHADPRLAFITDFDKLWVVISHPRYVTKVQPCETDRLTVRLPWTVTLLPFESTKLQVLDSSGAPVPQALVHVANYDGLFLPRMFPANMGSQTNDQGQVELLGYAPNRMQHVYVVSPTHGNHVVPLQGIPSPDGLRLFCRLGPVGNVVGQIQLPAGYKPSVLAECHVDVFTLSVSDQAAARTQSWSRSSVDANGRFVAKNLALGRVQIRLRNVADLPLRQSSHQILEDHVLHAAGQTLDVKLRLESAVEKCYSILDSDGRPVSVLAFSDQNEIVESAELRMKVPGELRQLQIEGVAVSGDWFPADPLNRYLSPKFGGIDLRNLSLAPEGTPQTITLARARSLIGQTTDNQGIPVAGAEVLFNYQYGPFVQRRRTFSDDSGHFELRGLPPATSVQVSARFGTWQTDSDTVVDRISGDPGPIPLVLTEFPGTTVAGTVVDALGRAISGARVTIQRGLERRAEAGLSELLQAEPLSLDDSFLLTDNDGRFEFSGVVETGQKLRLEINAHGYQTRFTPFLSPRLGEMMQEKLWLGTHALSPIPLQRTVNVTVVDARTSEAVAEVEVVCTGQYTDRQIGTTDVQGKIKVFLSDRPQLVAARHPKYQIAFVPVSNPGEDLVIQLHPRNTSYDDVTSNWHRDEGESWPTTSRQLFSELDVVASEATYFRQSLYILAMAAADPMAALRFSSQPDFPYARRESLSGMALTAVKQADPEQFLDTIRSGSLSVPTQIRSLTIAAAGATDPEWRSELLAEAVLLIQEGRLQGLSDQLELSAFVARRMLMLGYIDEAKDLIKSQWDRCQNLHAALEHNQFQTNAGVSRSWYPMLAIVDLPVALRLIPLTASQSEQQILTQECLAMAAIVSRDQMTTLAETREAEISDRTSAAQRPNFFINDFLTIGLEPGPFFDLLQKVAEAKQTAENVLTDRERIVVALTAMGSLPAGQTRQERLQEVLQIWQDCEVVSWFSQSDPANDVRIILSRTEQLSIAELDALLFEAIRKAPSPLDTRFLVEVHLNLICLLALRDVDLAKNLMEPMFSDGSWHLGIEYDQSVFRNQALLAAGRVDPVWAAQMARTLAVDYGGNDQSRRLEIYCSILEGIAQERRFRGRR
ncbi:MAG: carboxypeptidase-like regulatory domain-containing protein [Pirellulaceae bacterium]|nr:carboxypeptidase-like regulatory domain-containing protein [Pirellulaceae bacterium]